MTIAPGSYVLGPDSGTLIVRTGKGGAAAKAGHDLQIEVTRWSATLELSDRPAVSLSADPRSLRVVQGTGGISTLGDDDKAGIAQTIDKDVLKGAAIEFRSTQVAAGPDGRLDAQGELELFGRRRPFAFAVTLGDDGRVRGTARITQSDWGIKPYSTLFGTLKVADVVEVEVDATTRSPDDG